MGICSWEVTRIDGVPFSNTYMRIISVVVFVLGFVVSNLQLDHQVN